MTLPLLLSPRQAGELLGKSPESVRQWCRDGTLPAQRRGKLFLIPKHELERLVGGEVVGNRHEELLARARKLYYELGVVLGQLEGGNSGQDKGSP